MERKERVDSMHASVQETLKQLFDNGFTAEEVGCALLAHGTRLMLMCERREAVLEVAELMKDSAWSVFGSEIGH
jgi:hypothetical protein